MPRPHRRVGRARPASWRDGRKARAVLDPARWRGERSRGLRWGVAAVAGTIPIDPMLRANLPAKRWHGAEMKSPARIALTQLRTRPGERVRPDRWGRPAAAARSVPRPLVAPRCQDAA